MWANQTQKGWLPGVWGWGGFAALSQWVTPRVPQLCGRLSARTIFPTLLGSSKVSELREGRIGAASASLGLRWPHQQSEAMEATRPHREKSGRWAGIGEDTSGLLPDQGPCQLPRSSHSILARTAALMLVCVGGTLGVPAPPPWSPPRVLRGQGCAGGPAGSLTLAQRGRQPSSAPSDRQETEAQRGWVTCQAHTADRGLELAPESYPPET